ncbi:hypothetical protein BS50DRAFT_248810 [Corynespora cassiicola Philippines]|uniref:Uncharacterized protein n=1 Tax=Corynespora cassiicola Philippines TaxID=1448308 RepID=A0A2T2P3W4_CORCC|nr:hypothetical protein BS50DRAFT_248810 [Corynespora cassiicola Philippines]
MAPCLGPPSLPGRSHASSFTCLPGCGCLPSLTLKGGPLGTRLGTRAECSLHGSHSRELVPDGLGRVGFLLSCSLVPGVSRQVVGGMERRSAGGLGGVIHHPSRRSEADWAKASLTVQSLLATQSGPSSRKLCNGGYAVMARDDQRRFAFSTGTPVNL